MLRSALTTAKHPQKHFMYSNKRWVTFLRQTHCVIFKSFALAPPTPTLCQPLTPSRKSAGTLLLLRHYA